MGTVYHGLPIDLYRYNPVVRGDGYLAFWGGSVLKKAWTVP